MSFIGLLSVLVSGSLVLNYADFARYSGLLVKRRQLVCDVLFSMILLGSLSLVTYVCGRLVVAPAVDLAWKYEVAAFVAAAYLVAVTKGVLEYWRARSKALKAGV